MGGKCHEAREVRLQGVVEKVVLVRREFEILFKLRIFSLLLRPAYGNDNNRP